MFLPDVESGLKPGLRCRLSLRASPFCHCEEPRRSNLDERESRSSLCRDCFVGGLLAMTTCESDSWVGKSAGRGGRRPPRNDMVETRPPRNDNHLTDICGER